MGGSENERKNNWVKWDKVCIPIEEGGLNIRNLKVFNKALIGKWKWKIIWESQRLWVKVLKNRYGEEEVMRGIASSKDSNWWKKICKLYIGNWQSSLYYSIKEAHKDSTCREISQFNPLWAKAYGPRLGTKWFPERGLFLAWRLFQDMIATKINLIRMNIIDQEYNGFVGECGFEESVSYLFF